MKILGTFTQVGPEGVDAILIIMQDDEGALVFQTQIIRGPAGIIRITPEEAPNALAAIQKLGG